MAVSDFTLYPNSWINADGLFVKFGTDEQVVSRTGEYEDTYGPEQVIEIGFGFADFGTVIGNNVVINATSPIRKGSRIQECVLISETAVTGGTSISVGLIQDDFQTVIAAGGLINAEVVANLTPAGHQITYSQGTTNGGTLLGTTLTLDGFIILTANTSLPTGGQWVLVVRYYLPSTTE
jgi:hypothetical protein